MHNCKDRNGIDCLELIRKGDIQCFDSLRNLRKGKSNDNGGFQDIDITPKIEHYAETATDKFFKHLDELGTVPGPHCHQSHLVKIIDAKHQIVSGSNYEFTLQLRLHHGPHCGNSVDIFCKNIVIHDPMHNCKGMDCLEVIRTDRIQCFDSLMNLRRGKRDENLRSSLKK